MSSPYSQNNLMKYTPSPSPSPTLPHKTPSPSKKIARKSPFNNTYNNNQSPHSKKRRIFSNNNLISPNRYIGRISSSSSSSPSPSPSPSPLKKNSPFSPLFKNEESNEESNEVKLIRQKCDDEIKPLQLELDEIKKSYDEKLNEIKQIRQKCENRINGLDFSESDFYSGQEIIYANNAKNVSNNRQNPLAYLGNYKFGTPSPSRSPHRSPLRSPLKKSQTKKRYGSPNLTSRNSKRKRNSS